MRHGLSTSHHTCVEVAGEDDVVAGEVVGEDDVVVGEDVGEDEVVGEDVGEAAMLTSTGVTVRLR